MATAGRQMPRGVQRRLGGLRPLGLAAALALAGCGLDPDPVVELKGPTMGTYYSVKVPRPPAGLDVKDLQIGVEAALAQVVGEISTYDPGSELSRVNRNPSAEWIPASTNLLAIAREGKAIGDLSGGAFDVTIGPLVNLWGFGPERKPDEVPTADAIRATRERVGAGMLSLRDEPPALRKARGDMYIDLSAMGEGEGADRVAAYLDARGIRDYMVAVAGTLRVKGKNAKGEPWGIAIEVPDPSERAVERIVPATDESISTSGDYRNFFEKGGRRYSHHIDPKTGEPVAQRLASVSVVLPGGPHSARRADGLATALLVMGESRGPELAAREGIAALFIVREEKGFREIASPAFARFESP